MREGYEYIYIYEYTNNAVLIKVKVFVVDDSMDVKNLPIATVEYSVTRMAEDTDNVKTNSTLSAVVSKPSDILTLSLIHI